LRMPLGVGMETKNLKSNNGEGKKEVLSSGPKAPTRENNLKKQPAVLYAPKRGEAETDWEVPRVSEEKTGGKKKRSRGHDYHRGKRRKTIAVGEQSSGEEKGVGLRAERVLSSSKTNAPGPSLRHAPESRKPDSENRPKTTQHPTSMMKANRIKKYNYKKSDQDHEEG